MTRAAFLDRDGLLITNPVECAGEWQCFPEVQRACGELKQAGYLLVLCTNQPDLSRGLTTVREQDAIHDVLRRLCRLDAVFVCPHTREHRCECRKPRAGMILSAAATLGIDLADSWMIGDRETDVMAGKLAGCRTVRVSRDEADDSFPSEADLVTRNMLEAARMILQLPATCAIASRPPHRPYLQWESPPRAEATGIRR